MKILKPLIILSVVAWCISAFKPVPFKGKLEKAFEALSIYNYFDARELFYKSLKKNTAPASYGLAVIYERNDNPFHNLDSAFKFISTADSLYPQLEPDALQDYEELGASVEHVDSLKVRVDSLFFIQADDANSVKGWNAFISKHESEPYHSMAIEKLHKLAYQKALSENNSDAYRSFIDTYPLASQVNEAKIKLEESIFREETRSGLIVDYQNFIKDYPQSPHRRTAQKIVYEKFTQDGKLGSYTRFIEDNPRNPFVNKAWKRIYALEIKELSPESIAAFTLKYPNYPYLDDLQREYDLVTTKFYPVYNGKKWGFIDEAGELKIKYRFDFVEPYKESLALVGIGDSVAYINKAGRYINEGFYEDGFSFKRGFAIVMSGGQYGAINRLGEWIIEPKYDDVGEFSGGMFYVNTGELYGYADQNGEIVIELKFSDANDFMNGRAVVALDGRYGIINEFGELLCDFNYDWIDGFDEARNPSRFRKAKKFGLISLDGTVLDSALYDQIGEFKEGKALFALGKNYGFLNVLGDTVIEPRYTYSGEAFNKSYFRNGYAKVFQDDKVAIIDSTGKKVFPAIFQDVGFYKGNLIPIKKRGKWGYADKEVDLAIPYQYEMAYNFVDSVAMVDKEGNLFLIDSLGKDILDSTYAAMDYLGSYLLVADTLYGLTDREGNELVPMIYHSAEKVDKKVVKLSKANGKLDYFNYQTKMFIWRQD